MEAQAFEPISNMSLGPEAARKDFDMQITMYEKSEKSSYGYPERGMGKMVGMSDGVAYNAAKEAHGKEVVKRKYHTWSAIRVLFMLISHDIRIAFRRK